MPTRPTTPPESANDLFSAAEPISAAKSARSGDWISAHCDGGARGNPGPAGFGALIQSSDGSVIGELSQFLGIRTNNYAEYSGLLGCLQYALDQGHKRLRVVSDSELMVKQIQGKYQVKSPDLKPLYEEAKRRIAKLDAFEISHALRHKNKNADRLANEAMDAGMKETETQRISASAPKAVPYSGRSAAPPVPIAFVDRPTLAPVSKQDASLRGFTHDGVIHIVGGEKLPDGLFVKITRE